ncbi:hypothetical protein [Floricoccus penangensis]|uniref:hypothetical protein n=1 Tax=Floricoccus penangensis TaxID=1859475 RepID=UPI00203F09A0|nr:hypothetical protein [Floricoccus penangensis]URZ86548.1 hypothetical protein KIW23_05440 [Floricoccus penangensis]
MKKNFSVLLLLTACFSLTVACSKQESKSSDTSTTQSQSESLSTSFSSSSKEEVEKSNFIDSVKTYYGKPGVDNFYITGEVKVNKDSEIKPGIYDLVIEQGRGNVMSTQSIISENYVAASAGNSEDNEETLSKIRMFLTQDEILKFSNISKASLKQVNLPEKPSDELGTGDWIVGIDIAPGTYKLSSNYDVNANKDGQFYPRMEFKIIQFSEDGKKEKIANDNKYNHDNSDVLVKLQDNQIIQIIADSYGQYNGVKPDDMKLKFNKVN